jgi:hypothetical protein
MSFTIQPGTSTAQWHSLVTEAEAEVGIRLDEEVESYLVFLLMRFTSRPEIADSILALDYLHSLQGTKQVQKENMREVGDKCLLFAGLFPKRAEKRLVKISYYVDLGRSAYHHVAGHSMTALSALFAHLAQEFVAVMDTLQAIQQINPDNRLQLSPIEAAELLQDTGSRQAKRAMGDYSDGTLIMSNSSNSSH